MANTELQARLDRLVAAPSTDPEDDRFSHFRDDHVERSARLAGDLIKTAEAEGPAAAIEQAEQSGEISGVIKNAVQLMATHSPRARAQLAPPAVRVRRADPARAAGVAAATVIPVPNPDTQPTAERALDWYRQDPRANDHHSHWHRVYPGVPPEGLVNQKRQGELFLYMHQQMLARYETERLIAGLPPLVPFTPTAGAGGSEAYDKPIDEGFGLPGYTTRDPGRVWHDVANPQVPTSAVARAHHNIEQAIRDDMVKVAGGATHALTTSLLGAATEPSQGRDPDADMPLPLAGYGSLHNNGHVLTAELIAPAPNMNPGVMFYFETAICDPFFYRWHGHIDAIYGEYQDRGGTGSYAEFAANVQFRGSDDIALVPTTGIDPAGGDFAAWAVDTFGADPATFGAPAVDELVSHFVESQVTIPWEDDTTVDDALLLGHDPFMTVLRIENLDAADQDVTVRLFLAHAQLAHDRRRWIELDKLHVRLKPGVNVVAQPDARSSVIKRRDVTAPGAQPAAPADNPLWCDCGWPYGLLIPSGESSAQGTPFRLMAVVTNHALDQANEASTCGSMSFCGAEDDYPDARAMGYPFDRKFPGDDPVAAIAGVDSMAVRNLRIRCADPHPGA